MKTMMTVALSVSHSEPFPDIAAAASTIATQFLAHFSTSIETPKGPLLIRPFEASVILTPFPPETPRRPLP